MPAQILQTAGKEGRRDPAQRGMNAEPIHQSDNVRRETHADGHVGEGVFQDQVPADDPRNQLAHGDVGVGVGAAGDGDHGGQLGVTEAGKTADDGDQHQ